MRHRTFVLAAALAFSTLASAQAPHSPQELVSAVRAAIETKDGSGLAKLVHPSAEPFSVENVKADLMRYNHAEGLKVYVVPGNDKEATSQLVAQSPVPGFIKPLEEKIKDHHANGTYFPITPLGYLVVSGTKVGAGATGSLSSLMYGAEGGRYFVVFAKRK